MSAHNLYSSHIRALQRRALLKVSIKLTVRFGCRSIDDRDAAKALELNVKHDAVNEGSVG